MGQSVTRIFAVDGRGEASDENGFPDAPSVIFSFAGKDVEVLLSKMVLMVVRVLHHGRFEGAAGLFRGRKMLSTSFLGGPFRLSYVIRRTLGSIGAGAADAVDDARDFEFLGFVLEVDEFLSQRAPGRC